jgi:hypothetical protein
VVTVVVDGVVVVDGGRATLVDEDEIIGEGEQAAHALFPARAPAPRHTSWGA